MSNTAPINAANEEATLVVTNNDPTGFAIRTNGNIQTNSFIEARTGTTRTQLGLGLTHPQAGAG